MLHACVHAYTCTHPRAGGNTNITYRVDLAAPTVPQPQSFILRLFGQGTEALIDRAQEACCFHAVARRGLGPRLLGGFEGGRIEEFIHGRVRHCVRFYITTDGFRPEVTN